MTGEVQGKYLAPSPTLTSANPIVYPKSSEPSSTADSSLTYSPTSSEDFPEPKSRSGSSLGLGASGQFRFSPPNDTHNLQYAGLEGNVFSTAHSQASCRIASSGVTFLDHHDNGGMPHLDHGIEQAGFELVYPSPVTPIGVSAMHERASYQTGKEDFFDYVDAGMRGRLEVSLEGGV